MIEKRINILLFFFIFIENSFEITGTTERIVLDLCVKNFPINMISFSHEKTPQTTYSA